MSKIINARSPYYLKYRNATNTLTGVEVQLKIWNGLLGDVPTNVTYTISKKPLVQEVGNYVVFEISEIIRDYIETEYFEEAIDAVWVDLRIAKTFINSGDNPVIETDTYLALDGYGLFGAGVNPRTSTDASTNDFTPMVLQANKCIQFIRGRDIKIPVFSEYEPTIQTDIPLGVWNYVDDFWENSDPLWNQTSTDLDIVDSDDSADKIQYVVISTDNAVTGDTITFTSTTGALQTTTITIEEVCEPRYDAFRGIFYNRYGALQTFWFPKKSAKANNIKNEQYNANTIVFDDGAVSYSTKKHTTKRFNVIGRNSINLNTSLLQECYNVAVKDLLLSEQVWLEYPLSTGNLTTAPVILQTKSLVEKTSANDKALIQYNMDFDFAFETINNVR